MRIQELAAAFVAEIGQREVSTGPEYGDVPTWIAAVATVGALIFAGIAAWASWQVLKREAQRDADREEAERRGPRVHDPSAADFQVALTFRDAAGNVWRRDHHGRLRQTGRVAFAEGATTTAVAEAATAEIDTDD